MNPETMRQKPTGNDVVRQFHDDLDADGIANIIDQHERGGLRVETEREAV